MEDAIDFLLFSHQDGEKISLTTYKLTTTIKSILKRGKGFNYKQTLDSIDLDDGIVTKSCSVYL